MLMCDVGSSRLAEVVVSLLEQASHTSMRFQPHVSCVCPVPLLIGDDSF